MVFPFENSLYTFVNEKRRERILNSVFRQGWLAGHNQNDLTVLNLVGCFTNIFPDVRSVVSIKENYFPLQFIGWYWWLKRGPNANNDLPVTTISWNWRIITLAGIAISSLMLGYGMATYTDADFAYLDALTTMISIVAQYFLIKKVLESWVLWVSMDIIAIPLYFTKGLVVTSGIYGVFLIIALFGLYSWYKETKKLPESVL